MTKAERIIWYSVRAHRLEGASFRRQTPIGPYIVDFLSHEAHLIVEIDGGQHFEDRQEAFEWLGAPVKEIPGNAR